LKDYKKILKAHNNISSQDESSDLITNLENLANKYSSASRVEEIEKKQPFNEDEVDSILAEINKLKESFLSIL